MHSPQPKRGTLFLIVGPSGVGKDTLISASRDQLSNTHIFPKRFITRPATPDAEEHISVTQAAFEELERHGFFALTWQAHGQHYGIPVTITDELARGHHVVINVSRSSVQEAKRLYEPVRIVLITASGETLKHRLEERNRDTPEDVQARLLRMVDVAPDFTIFNDTSVAVGVAALLNVLRAKWVL